MKSTKTAVSQKAALLVAVFLSANAIAAPESLAEMRERARGLVREVAEAIGDEARVSFMA